MLSSPQNTVPVLKLFALACHKVRTRKRLEQAGVKQHSLLFRSTINLNPVQLAFPRRLRSRFHAVKVPPRLLRAKFLLRSLVAPPRSNLHQHLLTLARNKPQVSPGIIALNVALSRLHLVAADYR